MNTYSDKYSFYYDLNGDSKKVICVTYYKGKPVKGIAKCAPGDDFDIEIGKKLAYLRCNNKFLNKKFEHASSVYAKAVGIASRAEMHRLSATDFFTEVACDQRKAMQDLIDFEASLENIN